MKCEPSQHKKKDIKIVFGKRNDVSVRECFALILSLLARSRATGLQTLRVGEKPRLLRPCVRMTMVVQTVGTNSI